ncbi:MAG: hypothetical protein M5U31_07130 [Acidimicrobiia bacterium]|nr:hypothetical protein [Acidimicrobiia bacterium]
MTETTTPERSEPRPRVSRGERVLIALVLSAEAVFATGFAYVSYKLPFGVANFHGGQVTRTKQFVEVGLPMAAAGVVFLGAVALGLSNSVTRRGFGSVLIRMALIAASLLNAAGAAYALLVLVYVPFDDAFVGTDRASVAVFLLLTIGVGAWVSWRTFIVATSDGDRAGFTRSSE